MTFIMSDSQGDGWNGAVTRILDCDGNVLEGYGMWEGSKNIEIMCLPGNFGRFQVGVSGGANAYEVSWELLDDTGATLMSGGAPSCPPGVQNPCSHNYGLKCYNAMTYYYNYTSDDCPEREFSYDCQCWSLTGSTGEAACEAPPLLTGEAACVANPDCEWSCADSENFTYIAPVPEDPYDPRGDVEYVGSRRLPRRLQEEEAYNPFDPFADPPPPALADFAPGEALDNVGCRCWSAIGEAGEVTCEALLLHNYEGCITHAYVDRGPTFPIPLYPDVAAADSDNRFHIPHHDCEWACPGDDFYEVASSPDVNTTEEIVLDSQNRTGCQCWSFVHEMICETSPVIDDEALCNAHADQCMWSCEHPDPFGPKPWAYWGYFEAATGTYSTCPTPEPTPAPTPKPDRRRKKGGSRSSRRSSRSTRAPSTASRR